MAIRESRRDIGARSPGLPSHYSCGDEAAHVVRPLTASLRTIASQRRLARRESIARALDQRRALCPQHFFFWKRHSYRYPRRQRRPTSVGHDIANCTFLPRPLSCSGGIENYSSVDLFAHLLSLTPHAWVVVQRTLDH